MRRVVRKEIGWLLAEKYGGKRTVAAEKDIARLEKGDHIDYVIGWVNFLGCKIDLSQRPLIPRPETEYWTQTVIREMRKPRSRNDRVVRRSSERRRSALSPRHPPSAEPCWRGCEGSFLTPGFSLWVLDLFAGSGCVGIAVLKHVPGARVDFAEKEEKFLKQIEINAKLNGIEKSRYRVLRSDIFGGIANRTTERSVVLYDFILANPPYVAEKRKSRVQKSVLEQEPRNAVFGGKDGLYYIRRFLKEAKNYLAPQDKVYMEFDSSQKKSVEKLLGEFGYRSWEFHRDQFGKWRYCSISSPQL